MANERPRLSAFERIRIQMEEIVPLLRDLEEILGRDVVHDALARRNELRHHRARAAAQGAGQTLSVVAGIDAFAEGDVLEYEVKEASQQRTEFHVTRCGYHRMMVDLDAVDLGPLLICERDYEMASRIGLDLRRTKTCMQGGSHCDFVYTPQGRSADVHGHGEEEEPHEDR